jgi:hypothetical protein
LRSAQTPELNALCALSRVEPVLVAGNNKGPADDNDTRTAVAAAGFTVYNAAVGAAVSGVGRAVISLSRALLHAGVIYVFRAAGAADGGLSARAAVAARSLTRNRRARLRRSVPAASAVSLAEYSPAAIAQIQSSLRSNTSHCRAGEEITTAPAGFPTAVVPRTGDVSAAAAKYKLRDLDSAATSASGYNKDFNRAARRYCCKCQLRRILPAQRRIRFNYERVDFVHLIVNLLLFDCAARRVVIRIGSARRLFEYRYFVVFIRAAIFGGCAGANSIPLSSGLQRLAA